MVDRVLKMVGVVNQHVQELLQLPLKVAAVIQSTKPSSVYIHQWYLCASMHAWSDMPSNDRSDSRCARSQSVIQTRWPVLLRLLSNALWQYGMISSISKTRGL